MLIKSIENTAHLEFSEHTHQWYVEAHIEDGDGVILAGIVEHRDTPEAAVGAFFDRITTIPVDHYLAVTSYRGRREWRWNGAAFTEITRPEVLAAQRSGSDHADEG